MGNPRDVSASPAVQTLTSLFRDLASLPESSDADSPLGTCLGQTKSNKRCQRKVAGVDAKLRHLEGIYRSASACRSDEFYDALTEILVADHCHQHQQNGPLIRADFDQWRKARRRPSSGPTSPNAGRKKPAQQTIDGKLKTSKVSTTTTVAVDPKKTDSLAQGMHSLAISSEKKTTIVQKPSDPGDQDDDEQRIASVGYGRLVRKESVRSSGPIQTEMFKYLTPEQMVDGRLYILTHVHNHAIFKIGWTRTTAEERLNQSNNCYRNDTTIYYESPQPFAGALKAERLIHVHLQQHRIIITKCDKCGLGHTEWFQAPRHLVLDTVKAWEKFMKIPAYELKPDGKMHLNDSISRGLEFSLDRLARLGTTGKYARTSGTSMSDISSSYSPHGAPPPYRYDHSKLHPSSASVPSGPAPVPPGRLYYSSNSGGGSGSSPPSRPPATVMPSVETPERPGSGLGKKIRNSFNKAADFTFGGGSGSSRRQSYSSVSPRPSSVGAGGSTTPPRKDSLDEIEDFFTGMIFKLLPRDIKDSVEDGSVVEEEQGGGSSLRRLRDGFSGFVKEVKAGYYEREEERERERQEQGRRRSMGMERGQW